MKKSWKIGVTSSSRFRGTGATRASHLQNTAWRQPFNKEHARLRSESYGVATES